MKKKYRNLIILCAIFIGFKLYFIPPKNIYRNSKDIKQSKRIKAFIGEIKIYDIDTVKNGYEFPVKKIWVENPWSLERNSLGIARRTPDRKFKEIRFGLYPNNPDFKDYSFMQDWVIKDSLTKRIGNSLNMPNIDFHYHPGDTAVFNVFKSNKSGLNSLSEENLELIYKIYTVCDF